LEKSVWTDADFERMGWHDCPIHAIAFDSDDIKIENNLILSAGSLVFDIDYIFKWIHPEKEDGCYSFWIAPCTLMFKNVDTVEINLNTGSMIVEEQDIEEIIWTKEKRERTGYPTYIQNNWKIKLFSGFIGFSAENYIQTVKGKPVLTTAQRLTNEERGGINFNRQPIKL